ncbi:MAG TPA: MinD/ParA family protein [Leptolyngbyaceae cyanobacterium M33_DOE_097]|uniref:MinD/ParA family protein n=1 Tax=Oscillatoriales cyanobacterium SpSt-418 TaxID=2282169 RepID=A0A7C3KGZ6_9CYAN|nr:MinD/ParA family protein [Leptolyngbyaceae cyanobacterium M33_DOE_097]
MVKVISVHSFRGGTGKSNLTANLAVLTASKGNRVAIVDTDIQSPGIHVIFGMDEQEMQRSLNDYLWERCTITEASYNVTPADVAKAGGSVYLIPSSIKAGEIARILNEGYSVTLLNDGLRNLCQELQLDYLFIDTHPGLNKETLLSVAISDALVIILRPDRQDFQGTAVTLQVARKLDTPKTMLVVNKVLPSYDPQDVKEQVSSKFQVPVAGVFPVCDEMIQLASGGVFSLVHPNHPYTEQLKKVTEQVIT